MLALAPDIQVVGSANNGIGALELIPKLNPDVICTDLNMPKMDGYEFTKKVMETLPKPILIISISVQHGEDSKKIYKALEAGAVDVFAKPLNGLDPNNKQIREKLISKIRVTSGVFVFRKKGTTTPDHVTSRNVKPLLKGQTKLKIVVIGASTGGPVAFLEILKNLPVNFPLPIICVQHITHGFLDGLVSWLNPQCSIKVKVASDEELPLAGTAYFAPDGYHLKIDNRGKMVYLNDPSFNDLHKPSITVTLMSVAEYYGKAALGVLLTGMGSDGVDGIKSVSESGGTTIAQDERSSVIYGMPKLAFEQGFAQHSFSIEDITAYLCSIEVC